MRPRWIIVGLMTLTAVAIAIPTVLATSRQGGRASEIARPPEVLSVDYGRFRPAGAEKSYTAVRVRTLDPNGTIVGLGGGRVKGDKSWHADGPRCKVGDTKRGEPSTWTVPWRLPRGRHRIRITATSSSCDSRDIVESTEATFGLTVYRAGG
jgi:hypothetical protein